MKLIISILLLMFIGCGTVKETTTTTTEAVKIPSVVIHDTVETFIPYEVLIQNGINIDSAQRAYFIKNCKGTMNIDKDGLKATVSFLSKDNKGKAETIVQLTSEIEKKEQEIQATKKTVSTKSTPGELWILWNSKLYWICTGILGLILGAIGIILLRLKTTLLTKIIP